MKKISVFLPLLVMLLAFSTSANAQTVYAQVQFSAVNFHPTPETLQIFVKEPGSTTFKQAMIYNGTTAYTHYVAGAVNYPIYTSGSFVLMKPGSFYQVRNSNGRILYNDPVVVDTSFSFIITKTKTGTFGMTFFE